MRRISIIIILLTLAHSLTAQFYMHFNTGYSVSVTPKIHENRVIADSIIDQFRIKFPYGHGLNFGCSFGYAFSKNLFTEIGLHTSLFSRSRSDNDWGDYFRRNYTKLHLSGLNGDATMRNSGFQIAPLIGFSAEAGKFSPYIKAGLNILYLKSRYSNNYTYKYFGESHEAYLENTEVEREYTGRIKAGFRAGAGTLYKLTDKLMLSAEITVVNSIYHFDKSNTVSFKVDGVEKVEELEVNPEKLGDDQGLVDFSNVGLNVGVRYAF